MKTTLGYVTTFVSGFTVCALILHLGQRDRRLPGEPTLPAGRQALASALAAPPRTSRPADGFGAPSFADATEQVAPAIVNVQIEGHRLVPRAGLMGRFFSRDQAFQEAGAGIVLSADGYVLTNDHVVAPEEGQSDLTRTATLADGRRFSFVVIGRDPTSDVAVVKLIGVRNLTPARLGNSDQVRAGDWAIAVGNPYGFSSTVSLGIISAVHRRYTSVSNRALDDLLQTDAMVQPGNSGGALADSAGRVIGITTAIARTDTGAVGIGFAIPINRARRIAAALIQQGRVVRPFLGVIFSPVSTLDRTALEPGHALPEAPSGVLVYGGPGVEAVTPGSPAQRAGIQEWDVLLEADGKALKTGEDLATAIAAHRVGERLALRLWRAGQESTIEVSLAELPTQTNETQRQ